MKKLLQRIVSLVLIGCLSVGPFSGMSLFTEEAKAYSATYPKSTSGTFSIAGTKGSVAGSISKSAKWDDIELGTATITINESDLGYIENSTSLAPNTDYIIVMDSSHSMDFKLAGISSFCIYPKHYYVMNGKKVKLFGTSATTIEYVQINNDQTPTSGLVAMDFQTTANANYFYALMFNNSGALTGSLAKDFYKFTGYIFNSDGGIQKDGVEDTWKYKYYKDAYISKEVIDTLNYQDTHQMAMDDPTTEQIETTVSYWYKTYHGKIALNKITNTMKNRLKNASKYNEYKAGWSKTWENGGRAHLIYTISRSSASTMVFELDNTGHYNVEHKEIAYSNKNEDAGRWAYT